jgi:hypothetical protein
MLRDVLIQKGLSNREAEVAELVTKVEKQEHGYVIKFNNYPAVFAYVTKNESTFIDEIAKVLPQTTGTVSTTTPVQEKPVEAPATTTPQEASSTTAIATTTKKQPTKTTKATTTKQLLPKATTTATITSTTTEEKVVALTQAAPISYFSDKTVSNQNMRIYTKDGVTVVYAFVNNTDLLIANSVENILTLRSAILR